MKRIIIAVFFLLFSLNTYADNKSHKKAAEELLKTVMFKQNLKKLQENIILMEIQMNPSLIPYKEVLQKFLDKYCSYEAIKDEAVKIYMQLFTEEELKEITAFYKTKTGQKLLKLTPELAKRGAEIGYKQVMSHQDELYKMISQVKNQNDKSKP